MKKVYFPLIFSFLLILFVGCSKTDTRPDTLISDDAVMVEKAKPAHFVPFNATFEVSVDLESVLMVINGDALPEPPYPPTPPPPIPYMKYQEVYGEGNATHLGKTDVMLEQWWRPTLNPPPPPPGAPFHEWSGTGCGEIYFTAANGDLLLADYDGAIAVHYEVDYVETTLTGNFKDGGTGRFANAEGEFLWLVEFNPITNFGTVIVTGEIMYSK